MTQDLLKDKLQSALKKKEEKFCDLVWYARKPAPSDKTFWSGVPDDIKTGAFGCHGSWLRRDCQKYSPLP